MKAIHGSYATQDGSSSVDALSSKDDPNAGAACACRPTRHTAHDADCFIFALPAGRKRAKRPKDRGRNISRALRDSPKMRSCGPKISHLDFSTIRRYCLYSIASVSSETADPHRESREKNSSRECATQKRKNRSSFTTVPCDPFDRASFNWCRKHCTRRRRCNKLRACGTSQASKKVKKQQIDARQGEVRTFRAESTTLRSVVR